MDNVKQDKLTIAFNKYINADRDSLSDIEYMALLEDYKKEQSIEQKRIMVLKASDYLYRHGSMLITQENLLAAIEDARVGGFLEALEKMYIESKEPKYFKDLLVEITF